MMIRLGIDIGATWIKYGAIDAQGRILFSERIPTRGPDGRKPVVDVIGGCAARLVEWSQDAGHTPVSVGIGSPGTINPHTRKVQPPSPNLPDIVGIDLSELVRSRTGLPATIDNDANCAAWAEHCYGAGRGIDDLLCLTVGSGIGSGFIIGGRIHRGPSGNGGELGHVSIDWQGPPCSCGNRGCLENYTSANALLRRAAQAAVVSHSASSPNGGTSDAMTIGELFAAAHAGDPAIRGILADAASQLAFGILSAVNILDPEAVIIGGGVADADFANGGEWLAAIAETIRCHAFSDAGRRLRVGRAALGNDAGFIGAAALGGSADPPRRENN